LQLLGSHGMAAHAYPEMMALVATGVLRPAELITGQIALEAAPAALAALDRPGPPGIRVIRMAAGDAGSPEPTGRFG
jgi:alcohol dehydrogenase